MPNETNKGADNRTGICQGAKQAIAGKQKIITNLEVSVQSIISKTPIKDVRELEKQLLATERKLVELSRHTPQTLDDQLESKQLMDKAKNLREEIVIAERLKGTHDILHQRVKEIRQVIRLPYQEYRGDIFRSLVEKVVIKDKKNLRFVFKCGIGQDCNM